MEYIHKKLSNSKFNILFICIFLNYISLIYSLNYISMDIINYSNEQIKKISDDSFSFYDFINNVVGNSIYTKIKLGEPPQEIKTWINSEEYSYFLFKDTCILDSQFNENKSTTFEPNYNKTFYYNGYGETIYVNETITLIKDINSNNNKEIKIDKFPIMFMKDPANDAFFIQRFSKDDITGKTCATIGFRYISNYHDDISKNFLLVLKNLDIIDNYNVFIEYDKNCDEQYLFLGGYPNEIFKDKIKYKIENQRTTYIKSYNRFKPHWGFQCDKILSGEQNIEKLDIALHHNLGVIYGTTDYQEHIEKIFFNNYLTLKICTKEDDGNYTIYFCDKAKFNEEEMKKFPELKFVKTDLEESFNLTYQDLFFTKGNKVYFLIVFHYLYNEVWEMGKPFLRKYAFAYNFDSKLIWYYKDIDGEEIPDNKNNNNFIKLIIMIVSLSILLGVLSFIIGRYIYLKKKNKKYKAEELEEEVMKTNDNNNNNTNKENGILIED